MIHLQKILQKILTLALARIGPILAVLKKLLAAKRTHKVLKTGILALFSTILLLGLAFFSFRNALLRSVLDSRIRSYQTIHNGAAVSIDLAKFSSLAGIVLQNVKLRTASGDFAAALGKCSIQLSVLKMITGQVQFKRLALSDLNLDFRQETTLDLALTRPSGKDVPKPLKTVSGRTVDFGVQAAQLLDLYFTRIPDSLEIEHLTIHSAFDDIRQALYIPHLAIHGPTFATTIEVFNQGNKWACLMSGSIERKKKRLKLCLLPQPNNGPTTLPFIERQWGLKVDFTSLIIGLHSHGLHGSVLSMDGSLAINGLQLNHPRIAAENVSLQNAAIDYILNIGSDYFELDRRTRISFNKLSFYPYLKFQIKPTKQLTLKLDKTNFKADDFFNSLPAGLFTRLAGIQTSGELAYHLDFFIDFARPKELLLESGLEKHGFRIKHFGRINFRTVNTPFLYTAYEKDRAVRSLMVGPENPGFRTLDQIPSFLKDAVMISEDGAFWWHKGFLLEPFKDSIATNLREKRFVRGASTISMQLVKNLYLKRQKTIARKLEEMIITWLIEENRLIAKERMYEIYLNIIEWGPMIYGAQEAARFYFDKDVADLTLAEAIFMASIIPRPKRFMVSFDQDQQLRKWLQDYYSDVSYKMLKRKMISQQDYDMLIPDIRLKGPAKYLFKGNESMSADQLREEMEDLPEE